MILAIDIGNTHIALGGFYGDELRFVARLATDTKKTEDEYAARILATLALYDLDPDSVSGAIISSVVPTLNRVMQKAVKLIYGVKPILVTPGIKTGIEIKCDNPSSVGSDIICE